VEPLEYRRHPARKHARPSGRACSGGRNGYRGPLRGRPCRVSAHADSVAIPVTERMALVVNGTRHDVEIDTRTSLLDLLREQLGLTGPKKGCDHGQCGACTVLLDGRRALSCLALAVAHADAEIVTVEGLADGSAGMHPVQQAFVEHDALQCGFCTPGQVCSAVGMLGEVEDGWPSAVTADLAAGGIALDRREIRERMSGNLCRCGAYVNIVAAIQAAAR
jgi:xanthine dehydrogenase YagT iron-sulfur-binding subunit